MKKRLLFSLLPVLGVVGVITTPTAHASAGIRHSTKSMRVIEPDRIARVDAQGRVVGPIMPFPKTNGAQIRDVPAYAPAYDATNTNPALLPGYTGVHSNFYGGNAGLWTFADDYRTGPWADDTTLAPGTGYQTARLYQITYLWNPAGSDPGSGTGNLAMQINNVLSTGTAFGPAVGTQVGGFVTFNDNLPAGFYTIQVDLSSLDFGLGLGPQSGGGVKVVPYTYSSQSNLTTLTTAAWQMGRGNLCSPGDPNYPGSNPSSTADTYWTDDYDVATGPFVNAPNYAFEDLTSTSNYFAEFYSGDYSISGLGELSPLVGMFVDTNARTVKGKVVFDQVTPGREPKVATIYIGNGSTTTFHYVALGPNGEYSILDLNNSGAGGSRQVSVKADHWLRRTVSTNTSAGSVVNVDLTLANGDVDTDDVVSVFDYIWLSDNFDKDSSASDWLLPTGPNGISPSFADLDRDDVVSVFDYIILSDHFDQAGDALP